MLHSLESSSLTFCTFILLVFFLKWGYLNVKYYTLVSILYYFFNTQPPKKAQQPTYLLLSSSSAGKMAWLSNYNFVLTIHLSLIRQDNLPPSARRIDGQGLLEALLNLRAPHSLSIIVCRLVCRVAHPLHVLGRALAAAPAAGINRGGWALQAGAWSWLGRNLEIPNAQHTKRLLSTTELGTFASKTQHNTQC